MTNQIAEARKVLEDLNMNVVEGAVREITPEREQALSLALRILERVDEGFIENVLGEIEIPMDTNPMYVEETNNPAVIKIKSKYASIIAQAIITAMVKE